MPTDELSAELLTLWDFADPAVSEARLRALSARVGEDPEAAAIVATQVARAQGLQRRFADAHATLDALETLPATRGARVAVRLALERGRVIRSSGDPAGARAHFDAAFERARAAGEEALAVDAAHMLAIVETDPAQQAAWNERALALAEASSDALARRWRAPLLNNLGWTRHGEGRHADALALFERALVAREELGDTGSIRVARWCVARAKRSLGRVDEALAVQQALAAEIADAGASEDGFVCEEIAECLVALDRAEEARPWYARAHAALSQDPWFVEAEPARLARMKAGA